MEDSGYCINCSHYEERTGFCRANPPTPYHEVVNGRHIITSKFPKIQNPNLDYCALWSSDEPEEEIEEQVNG